MQKILIIHYNSINESNLNARHLKLRPLKYNYIYKYSN